uniref:DNA-directed RNA polymerase I subunit RPA1 n=1 Tax=Mantoniella antarctica TaxID=81844 RepID=A0A7S0SX43_9CHLO
MAHTARVLKGQRTIRMHYANCSTYNADFDGDEMNIHFPQDHLARAEAYEIVRADQQFTVPTDGKPLRGLIQDHVCGGVLLTKRDTFLTRAQFQQYMYLTLVDFTGPETGGGALAGHSLRMPPPTVVKPQSLWTGKQLFTTVLEHMTHGRAPMTFSHGTKTPANYWGGDGSGEGELIVRRNYVCSGILDKNVFGKFGLVHAVVELHGPVLAGDLISALSRLLTAFLQAYGMTCGMDDLLLQPASEVGRRAALDEAQRACRGAAATFAEADASVPDVALRRQIATRLREREGAEATLDMRSSSALNKVTSATVAKCLPHGTRKPFPKNCLSLMTQSGAKGSMVNFSQIAACLGQQELEGRRVPRMTSGKTLPCFQPHDTGPRAGGFIEDRFLTGLRPQEYFFHCMAGREGLVDTAVKTSRSGYLQRCLVKNLEALRVHYDYTVRDCDGAIVQFQYGDDAVDVTKGGYMEQFRFLAENPELLRLNLAGAEAERARLRVQPTRPGCTSPRQHPPIPTLACRPVGSTLGTLPERFTDKLDDFLAQSHPGYFAGGVELGGKKSKGKSKSKKGGGGDAAGAVAGDGRQGLAAAVGMTAEEFTRLMNLRYLSSLAAPGEAVGCVAAQSVGEPSTQMTLNTFHFAGRGEANVTLGIPRLRELLMAAAKKLATPVMTMTLLQHAQTKEAALNLARRLRRVRLAELVRRLTVTESPCGRSHGGAGELARTYSIKVELRAAKDEEGGEDVMDENEEEREGEDKEDTGKVSFTEMAAAFEVEFVRRMYGEIRLELRRRGATRGQIHSGREEGTRTAGATAGAGRDEDGGDGDGDDKGKASGSGAGANKKGATREIEREEGEEEDDSDAEDEDEEGAKTEGRRGARGDGGGYAEADVEERAEKASRAKAITTGGGSKGSGKDGDGASSSSDSESGSGSDSDSSDDDDSDSDEEGIATAAGSKEKKKAAKAKAKAKPEAKDAEVAEGVGGATAAAEAQSAKGTKGAKGAKGAKTAARDTPAAAKGVKAKPARRVAGVGSDLLESLEDITESVVVDRTARTCMLTLSLRLSAPRLLMLEIAEAAAAATVVRSVAGIDKTFVIGKEPAEDPTGKSPLSVQTDGVNFAAAMANDDLVDCPSVKTNDVYAMLTTYGVEAARQTLVAEVRGVFGVYGIAVDSRHLSLIGDFMMQQGDYRPCSRAGMETSTSPFLKMSFETAAAFLVDATLKGSEDTLESPSARIVLGRVVEMGTGAFGLRYDMRRAGELQAQQKKAAGAF